MTYSIDLTPRESARVNAAARRAGIAPGDLIKRLALEHLSKTSTVFEDRLDAKLCEWQTQDQVKLMPDLSAEALYSRWSDEDTKMSLDDRHDEDRLWHEIEQSLSSTEGRASLRRLG